MPFPKQTPRAYAKNMIEEVGEDKVGCYGIYKAKRWIYVGKGNVRQRLLGHLAGDNPRITRYNPTNYVFVLTDDYDAEEKRLIKEYNPICNKKVG